MKKRLLLYSVLLLSALSSFGQKKLQVSEKDMTAVIYREAGDNETVVEIQSNVPLTFESTMDKQVNVYEMYPESGFYIYKLKFSTGSIYNGRKLTIKSYGFDNYDHPLELQAKVPVGLRVLNPDIKIDTDIITLRTGDHIQALVQKISEVEVEYKMIDNLNGPNYTLKKSDIFMITYANGSKDVYSDSTMPLVDVTTSPTKRPTPTTIFASKETITFNSTQKLEWQNIKAQGATTSIKKGYYEISGKRNPFSPTPVKAETFAKAPFDIQKDFRITVKLQVINLTGTSVFRFLINSGRISLAISERDWAAFSNSLVGQGIFVTPKGSIVNLSIQKEGLNLFFYYNDSVLCYTKFESEIESQDIGLSLMNVVNSAEVRINEIIIEQ